MATNTLPLPGLTFRALPTHHINSTRAADAVAKMHWARHQADDEAKQLITRLRDEAEADSAASAHRCIHMTMPPTLFERGDKPTAMQIAMALMLIVGFTIAAVIAIHDGAVAQHPHRNTDMGTMATSVEQWRDGEVGK